MAYTIAEAVLAKMPQSSTLVPTATTLLIEEQMELYEFASEGSMTAVEKSFIAEVTCLALIPPAIDKYKQDVMEATAGPTKAKFQSKLESLEALYTALFKAAAAKAAKLGIEMIVDLSEFNYAPGGFLKGEENAATLTSILTIHEVVEETGLRPNA